jgi:nitroimidazol reductase NimA-like FMN-containing flavoprotein (pyridoxamine 5'-phosphate oxidase superfamily)
MDETDLIMSPEQIDAYLARPITGVVATDGPTIRPLWYHWEDSAFWIINGDWANLKRRVQKDPRLAICVESSNWETGQVFQVIANGEAEIVDYDIPRGRRLLSRYLGPDETTWSTEPDNYPGYLQTPGPPGIVFLRVVPTKLVGLNFTYASAR